MRVGLMAENLVEATLLRTGMVPAPCSRRSANAGTAFALSRLA
jgi:hypothetical protein